MAKKKHPLKEKLQSLKHQATHPLETLKNVVNNVKTESKKFANKVEEAAIYAPLAPFAPAMQIALKQKGVQPAKGLKSLSLQFFHTVIKHNAHLEHWENQFGQMHLQHAEEKNKFSAMDFVKPAAMSPDVNVDMGKGDVNDVAAGLAEAGATEGAAAGGEALGIPPVISKKLAKMIIDFFKKLVGPKHKGKLSKDQQEVVAAAAPVQDTLAATVGGTDTKGNFIAINKEGDVSHILDANGNVIATGAEHNLTPKHGIHRFFSWS